MVHVHCQLSMVPLIVNNKKWSKGWILSFASDTGLSMCAAENNEWYILSSLANPKKSGLQKGILLCKLKHGID